MGGPSGSRTAQRRRGAAWFLAWALAYAVALTVGRWTRMDATMVSLVWPAAGASTVWLLAAGRRRRAPTLVALYVVTVLANAATDVELLASLGWGVVNVLHAVVAVAVLRRGGLVGLRPLTTVADLTLLLRAALAAAAVSAVTGSVLAAWRFGVPLLDGVEVILVRNAVSTLVVASVVLALAGASRRALLETGPADTPERALVVGIGLLGTGLLLLDAHPGLAFLLLPTTVWAANRTGARLTSLLAGVQSTCVVAVTYAGAGPFSSIADTSERVLAAQSLLAALTLVGLWLALADAERAEAHATSRDALEQLRQSLEAALVGQATLHLHADGEAVVTAANPALGRLLSQPPDELVGQDWLDLVLEDDRDGLRSVVQQMRQRGGRGWEGELRMHARGGDVVWVNAVLGLVRQPGSAGDPTVVTAQVLDITARKQAEERLSHVALHDDLTGLANRSLWRDRAQRALDGAAQEGSRVGVVFVDLDRFKAVNDQYGHEVGDHLLQEVASRLSAHVRPQDTVARLGGDEFVVLCPGVEDELALAVLADRLLGSVGPVVVAGAVRLVVTVSIGTVLGAPGERDVQRLLRQADGALYVAKDRGRSRVEAFGSDGEVARRALPLLAELRRALAEGELVVHHQPVVDLASGRPTGVEVLVRWQHPERGLLPPSAWMPALEHSDLVYAAGLAVLELGCTDGAVLQERWGPLSVSINVSARQLDRRGFVDSVQDTLARTGMPAHLLVLEITETHLLAVEGELLRDLHALRELGVRLAADDVGTGYSTLAHLVELPIDVLKLDRSFVAGLGTQQGAHAVSNGVVAMARDLGIHCVAEGVETAAQAQLLRDMGYTSAQGFLWSRGLPVDELLDWLDALEAAHVPVPVPAPRPHPGRRPRPTSGRSTL